MVSKQPSEFLREARRCAAEATRGDTTKHRQMFEGLSRFYDSLASSEPAGMAPAEAKRREPPHRKDASPK
jgi:hypothetical protein